jgi:myo-inositol-1(or 4)-monophosphatase
MLTAELCDRIERALPQILAKRDAFREKPDGSYVSEGDLLVQSIAVEWVSQRLPEFFLISEEQAPFDCIWDPAGSYVILDPIDGTENFVSGLKEWGVGVSIFADGRHIESCIFLPELGERQITGMPMRRYRSRIAGLSSSLTGKDLCELKVYPWQELRIIGCAMYNLLMVARGSFQVFENAKGVNCWDILPGLNLAREVGCRCWVNELPYGGEVLFPTGKYRVRIEQPQVETI